MDWLILLLLIPAVLAPVVLIHGFAGCSFHASAGISAPTNLTATPTPSGEAGSAVALAWEVIDTTIGTQIERAMEGEDFVVLAVVTDTTFTDQGLAPGATFLYQLRATNSAGVTSTTSNMATVTTFKTAFLASNLTADTNQPGDEGITLVQILASTLLQASGQLVNLTLRGPSTGSLTLDKICISNQDPTGPPIGQDYQPDVTPITVASAFALNNDTKPISPVGSFFLDQSKTLLVAFDISLAPGTGTGRFATPQQGGAFAWAKKIPGASLNEAGVKPRSAGYGKSAGPELFLVQKIEVM